MWDKNVLTLIWRILWICFKWIHSSQSLFFLNVFYPVFLKSILWCLEVGLVELEIKRCCIISSWWIICFTLQAEGGAPEPKYSDLNSLVADYMKKGDKNGLAFGLKFPVPPDRGEEVDSGVYMCHIKQSIVAAFIQQEHTIL